MKKKMVQLRDLKKVSAEKLVDEWEAMQQQLGSRGEENWKAAFDAMTEVAHLDNEDGQFHVDGANVVHPIERVMDEFLSEMIAKNVRIERLQEKLKTARTTMKQTPSSPTKKWQYSRTTKKP